MKNPGRKKNRKKKYPGKKAYWSKQTNINLDPPLFLHKTILTISNVGVGKPATRGAIEPVYRQLLVNHRCTLSSFLLTE